MTRNRLMLKVYGNILNPPNPRTMDVYIHNLRKLLQDTPYVTENQYHDGWRLVNTEIRAAAPIRHGNKGKGRPKLPISNKKVLSVYIETNSYTKAAEKLGVSPSFVQKRLQGVEIFR